MSSWSAVAEKAIEADLAGRTDEAVALYLRALRLIRPLAQDPKTGTAVIKVLVDAGQQYKDRVRELRRGGTTRTPVSHTLSSSPASSSSSLLVSPAKSDVSLWHEIVGQETARIDLTLAITSMLLSKRPEKVENVLLFGPPGTGKTMLATSVAAFHGVTFFNLKSSDVMSKWQGDSERNLVDYFKTVSAKVPCVFFVDEVDGMMRERRDDETDSVRRLKNTFLTELNDLKGVLVLGATNVPWDIDRASLRRFPNRIYVALPEKEERLLLLRRKLPLFEEVASELLEKETEGFSQAELVDICSAALKEPMRRLARSFFHERDGVTERCECDPRCEGALRYSDLSLEKMREVEPPPLTPEVALESLRAARPVTNPAHLKRFEEWIASSKKQ